MAFLVVAAAVSAARAESRTIAYVQATIVEPDPTAGSLGFVTAGGRSRTARASGPALASLRNLQPGDEAILTLEGPADRPVVTSVKVSRVVPPPPPPDTLASPYAWTQMVPSRPSWPNPYSRMNPGLPLRPTRARAARPGTLTVVPAATVRVGGGAAAPQPAAAPAALVAPDVRGAATPPAPARADSTVDILRTRGARDLEAAVTRLAAEARSVDSAYARFKASCPTATPARDEGSREWFALWDGAAVSEACAPPLDEIRRLAAPIRTGMLAAHEAARSAWVLPGTMREIRRRHAMDWSGWDR
jgi:hypothetical protein